MPCSAVLAGKRIVLFVEQDFEDSELTGPRDALRSAGATVVVVGPTAGSEFRGKKLGTIVVSDVAAGSLSVNDFDALVIPGGYAPDKMRMRHAMVDLTREAMDAHKPVAAICHGPQLLISAGGPPRPTPPPLPARALDGKNTPAHPVGKPAPPARDPMPCRKTSAI